MSDHEAKRATPHATLLAELLDSRTPKSEREHAAKREIERLTASLKRANETAEHFERHWYLRGDEIEQIEWIACAERLPDDDETVLLCPAGQDDEVWPGWRDGDGWRWASHGSPVNCEITHWAAWPAGPRCCMPAPTSTATMMERNERGDREN